MLRRTTILASMGCGYQVDGSGAVVHGGRQISRAVPARPPAPAPTREELEARVWVAPGSPEPEPEPEPAARPPEMFGQAMLAQQLQQHRQGAATESGSDAGWSSDEDERG